MSGIVEEGKWTPTLSEVIKTGFQILVWRELRLSWSRCLWSEAYFKRKESLILDIYVHSPDTTRDKAF